MFILEMSAEPNIMIEPELKLMFCGLKLPQMMSVPPFILIPPVNSSPDGTATISLMFSQLFPLIVRDALSQLTFGDTGSEHNEEPSLQSIVDAVSVVEAPLHIVTSSPASTEQDEPHSSTKTVKESSTMQPFSPVKCIV